MSDDKRQPTMSRAMLPLNALRAFDAAARHMSFRKGAAELAVTPAAVSQQVRSLEEYLGVPLFRRLNNRLELTPQAKKAVPLLAEAFGRIEEVVRILRAVDDERALRVSAPSAFASKWLIPRLGDFYALSEELVVRVIAQPTDAEIDWGQVDVAIVYGHGQHAGYFCEQLLGETVYPVCAPSLLGNAGPPAADALAELPLIHDDSAQSAQPERSWEQWFAAAGTTLDESVRRDLHVGQLDLAVAAAIAGRGVALAPSTLVATDLDSGRLVRVSSQGIEVAVGYHLVFPEAHLELAKVQTFVGWLRDVVHEAR